MLWWNKRGLVCVSIMLLMHQSCFMSLVNHLSSPLPFFVLTLCSISVMAVKLCLNAFTTSYLRIQQQWLRLPTQVLNAFLSIFHLVFFFRKSAFQLNAESYQATGHCHFHFPLPFVFVSKRVFVRNHSNHYGWCFFGCHYWKGLGRVRFGGLPNFSKAKYKDVGNMS